MAACVKDSTCLRIAQDEESKARCVKAMMDKDTKGMEACGRVWNGLVMCHMKNCKGDSGDSKEEHEKAIKCLKEECPKAMAVCAKNTFCAGMLKEHDDEKGENCKTSKDVRTVKMCRAYNTLAKCYDKKCEEDSGEKKKCEDLNKKECTKGEGKERCFMIGKKCSSSPPECKDIKKSKDCVKMSGCEFHKKVPKGHPVPKGCMKASDAPKPVDCSEFTDAKTCKKAGKKVCKFDKKAKKCNKISG